MLLCSRVISSVNTVNTTLLCLTTSTRSSSHQSHCSYVNTTLIHNRSYMQNIKHNIIVKQWDWYREMDSVRWKTWDEIPWVWYREMRYHGVALDCDINLLLLFVLFGYLLQLFTDFYSFVLCIVLYLLPLWLVPVLYSTIHSSVSWLHTWYFYHAIALSYDFPLPIALF
jgi:hypothetical protein